MCPQAPIPPVVELDEYSTDETVIKSLVQLKNGHTLPSNILSEVDPYQVLPSNLPAGMWFFSSASKRDTENGFWKSTGEACEVYKTSSITGMRKTLQFYEGQAHDGQKTNWIMQEYTTTEKFTSKLDPRALYRVFMVDDSSSGGGHPFKSELNVKNNDDVAGPSDAANQSLDQLHDDYDSRDFLELDDLDNPLSCTTSFNSSCMTQSMTSEEYFDSDALMRELGDDIVDQEVQDSRIKLNLSTPAKLEHVVLQQTTTTRGSLDNVNEPKPCTEQTSERNPIPESKSTLNEVNTAPPPPPPPPQSVPPPPQSVPPPQSASSPPSSSASSSSSNGSGGSSKEEKKDRLRRTKKRKMMKFLCFMAF